MALFVRPQPVTPSQLICLPTELLLIILDFLSEPNLFPIRCGEEVAPISYSIRHIRPLSWGSRRLRQLCLPLLFSSLKFTYAQRQQLPLLEAKCAEDTEFAGLIRKLNLADVDFPEVLPSLLSHLQFLEWLDLHPCRLDADLLATVNSHPNLKTVAVCDTHLGVVARLVSSTSLSLSKILIPSARLEGSLTPQSLALRSTMERGPRLPHLILSEKSNIKAGVGALFIPGLEILDIPIYMYMEFMSWLPAFVERHKSLSTITFNGDQYNFRWSQNPDILFPLQFRDAVESLDRTVSLNGFSISRTGSASLDTWRVTALELTLHTADGISGLRLASALAPELSSLVIRMSSDDSSRRPIPVDDLASALGCFPSLRRLNLHKIFQHLVFEGPAPWDSPPDADLNTSNCMIAHAALHWIMARVAQCTPTLELVHGADQGYDGKGHLMHPWRLEATYQVRRNFGLDFDETPHFIITDRFSQPR